jgi:uncharacterized lipoprotein YmbA
MLATTVNLLRLVVRLQANTGKTRGTAHPRSGSMHVKVAAHVKRLNAGYEQAMKVAQKEGKKGHGTH